MRKFVGLFAAAALLVPAAMIVSQPAGAAGGTLVRRRVQGSATFTPALPTLDEHDEGQGRAQEHGHRRRLHRRGQERHDHRCEPEEHRLELQDARHPDQDGDEGHA